MPATTRSAKTPVVPKSYDRVFLTPGDHVGRLVPRSPVSVLLDTTLLEIAEIMAEESIGVVLVRGPHGPAGIVSERDLALAIAEDATAPDRMRARDVMTPEIASIDAGESILAAADVMLANEIRHVVVTSGATTVGLVSMRDVVGVLAGHAARS